MSSNTQQTKKMEKTTTKKSVQQTAGTAASTRQREILSSLTVSAELDGTKVYHNMGATNGQNNNSNHSPISQALTTEEYIKYHLPTVLRLIRSQTQAVLATMPLTVNEGIFSTSNHPIADVVQSYTRQQAEGKSFAGKDSLTKSDFSMLVQKDKSYKEIHLANKTNLESKFGETVVDLLDYDMLSDIESDEEKNKTRYTPRNRHPLMDEYFTVLKKQRLANKGPDVIGNSVYPIILRNTELSNEKKAHVAAWIHTCQQ
ncbi:hypothetical protein PHYBLDRAFT_149106 [Phycomyces blakesleeanus NRRL 1555(-)]|uniref:Uncharacterized protein n=1 Tax=Phycomyces blakesleeanus (strain ATCC 8743b / DSM 1359 / FGSC 10004 / NBRC 33097 / NRRL 1555) TaxID=763407 RepID=A0A162NI99_PHYB8|nr:hypothetical protein PHYBLDRAFT_149106 [Phycomyces blakesleeanus NRRL 1555(-)]OAD69924.1 hypothetical protein PHYBLDRAFT_149106 [Phycomyces blakesleeanus NRRL 1555(-)]|eukprot:XP_018287964.1 hypothetical protein PHYBLDRAFT_149106 [Phycomyces blakesleeanus NRRL 1555(-)]